MTDLFNQTEKGATFSSCGNYRYQLWRIWDKALPTCMFIMLNPSTADADKDDPTIRRCEGFAKSWGYGGLLVGNLFAYRATNPKELLEVPNPWGDKNIYCTRQLTSKVDKVICAWGNKPILDKILRNSYISPFNFIDFAKDKLYYLELSKDGTPKHPLYLKKELIPIKFEEHV